MARVRVKISLSFRIETLKRLEKLAKLRGLKRSTLADELMSDALDQAELTASATTDPVVMGAFVRAMAEPGVLRSLAASMRADLSDDQLALFSSRLAALEGPAVKGKKRRRV